MIQRQKRYVNRTILDPVYVAKNEYFIFIYDELTDIDRNFSEFLRFARSEERWEKLFWLLADALSYMLCDVVVDSISESREDEVHYDIGMQILVGYYDGRDVTNDISRILDSVEDYYDEVVERHNPSMISTIGRYVIDGWACILEELTHLRGDPISCEYIREVDRFYLYHY